MSRIRLLCIFLILSLSIHQRDAFISQTKSIKTGTNINLSNKILQRNPSKFRESTRLSSDLLSQGVEFITNLFHTIGNSIENDPVTSSLVVGSPEAAPSLLPLGNDLLIFLCATIGIVPLFKWLEASPVIGFLSAGLLMGPAGLKLFSDLKDMEQLADFGVLFLLFEQGLELTVDRLKSLSKYAFGMGSLQVLLSTVAFLVFPFVGGVTFLEVVVGSDPILVDITRIDEALVIGAALSLSSSAFVLKILQESNQLSTKSGSASLGILLLQDIAVVPLLVLLPIIESNHGALSIADQLSLLGATFAKALFGLGGILVVGGAVVRYLFSMVAKSNSSETFVALCLLVAVGIGALTDSFGLSSTLGAFVAGTLLAESNYRTQIETDIKPFKGILLGLFFLTTGASVDPFVIQQQWPTVLALLVGLITFKAVITTAIGPFFGLSKSESVRTGLLLSGGGEFAFVVLTLADKLDVLPDQLAKLLVGVVVMSMALTPSLANFGERLAGYVEEFEKNETYENALKDGSLKGVMKDTGERIVICGYGAVGQSVVRHLTTAAQEIEEAARIRDEVLAEENREITEESAFITDDSQPTSDQQSLSMITDRINKEDLKEKTLPTVPDYIVFDLDPTLVIQGYKRGANILYGDGSQSMVLETAGVRSPKAFVVTYSDSETAFKSVERIRECFPKVPIIARATTGAEYFHLLEAGATKVFSDETESSLVLGSAVLSQLGLDDDLVLSLRQTLSEEMCSDIEDKQQQLKQSRIDRYNSRGTGEKIYTGDIEMGTMMKPIINKAAKNMANIMTSVQQIKTETFTPIDISVLQQDLGDMVKEVKGLVVPEEDLGVKVCVLPSRSEEDETENETENENEEFYEYKSNDN